MYKEDEEILDIFIKVAVNTPLLNVIKQIPKYAKSLKDLCTHKRRLKGSERVNMGRNVSDFIQPKTPEKSINEQNVSAFTQAMPQKCKDPRTFAIPCTIGGSKFENYMMELVASINVMPTYVYINLILVICKIQV